MFDEKAQCFIDQYNQFKVIGPNDEEANVNGKVSILGLFHHRTYKLITMVYCIRNAAHIV